MVTNYYSSPTDNNSQEAGRLEKAQLSSFLFVLNLLLGHQLGKKDNDKNKKEHATYLR